MAKEQKVLGRNMISKTLSRTTDYYIELNSVRGTRFSAFSDRLWANYNVAHGNIAQAITQASIGEREEDVLMKIDENGQQQDVGNNVYIQGSVSREDAENWFSKQFGLLAAAEKYLKNRTWKDILLHPFRSIAENIAVSDLRDRIREDNKTMPKAEMEMLTKIASEYSDKANGHIEALTHNGKIIVQANLGFKKNPQTNLREPTKTGNVAITYDQLKEREKDPRKFDIKMDRLLKHQEKVAKEKLEAQKQIEEANRKKEEAKRKKEEAKRNFDKVKNRTGIAIETEELNELLEGDRPLFPDEVQNSVSQKEQDEFQQQITNEVDGPNQKQQLSNPTNEQPEVNREVGLE